MDVELVAWPVDNDRRMALSVARQARLLMVARDAEPPAVSDELEDWIRLPARDDDVRARMAALAGRLAPAVVAPELDADGVLRAGDRLVTLPPVEARLTRALLERFGAVVGREVLARAGWPYGSPGRNALDVHVLRLRRRLAAAGLEIKTVRSRGYLLAAAQTEMSAASR